MTAPAAYDAFADWYEGYTVDASPYMDRVRGLLGDLLGAGEGGCLDLCCGGGAHAAAIRSLGRTPLGVDLSIGQLRYAAGRLPVAAGDAARLPVRTSSVPAVACVLAHTDVPDWAATVREVARVLRPGGRFAQVGVHPCFVGHQADRSVPDRIVIDTRYGERVRSFDAWTPHGVRARVGAWHVPLADLLNAVTAAGLRIERVAESGPNGIADVFGLAAVKP
jgi:SAM-dependent methyltransferase